MAREDNGLGSRTGPPYETLLVSSFLGMLVFFLVASTIWGLAHFYVGRRLLTHPTWPKGRRLGAWAAVGLLALVGPLTLAGNRLVSEASVVSELTWAAYTYMGFFSIAFVLVLARDVVLLAAVLVERVRRGARAAEPTTDDARRSFLVNATNTAALGASGALTAWGVFEARRLAEVVRVEVPIEGLPEDLEGYRIAQISDIHVGPTIKGAWLRKIVARVNELDADLVAVTGDLVDGSVADLGRDVRPLGELRGKDGVYFVTGNHEYYSGAEEWCAYVEGLGLTVLNNAHRVVARGGATMIVAGVTDYSAARILESHASDPRVAVAGAPPADLKILLAHQPRSYVDALRAGFDLQLSGHTHGGQFFPWNLFVRLAQPFSTGLHVVEQMAIYVSRGTGYWGPPLRGGVPSEITLLTLRRA
jgi:predicted MPP superfamily phosphohydrolase